MPWVSGKCLTRSCTSRIISPLATDSGVLIEDLLGVVAGCEPAGFDLTQLRAFSQAPVPYIGAARGELARGGDLHQTRRKPLDGVQFLAFEVDPRNRFQQPLGV